MHTYRMVGEAVSRPVVPGTDARPLIRALSDLGPAQLEAFGVAALERRDAALRRDPHTARAWGALADLVGSIRGGTEAPTSPPSPVAEAEAEVAAVVTLRRRRRQRAEDDADDYAEYGGEGG